MNEQELRKAEKTAYPKANQMISQMIRGDRSLTIENFTDDELKSILLTIDGVGRKFKTEALDELIERAQKIDGMF